jgi:hypothetical protein
MDKYIWASPHNPTEVQLAELKAKGTVEFMKELNPDLFASIINVSKDTNYMQLAYDVVSFAAENNATLVQPAGNPKLLMSYGVNIMTMGLVASDVMMFAYSQRVSVDEKQTDGSVIKRVVFNHEGFI